MSGYSLSMVDEAVITDLLAKNARLEEEIEYLRNELASMRTGPQSKLLEENRNLRHELAVLVHGVDVESERLREELAAVTAERDELAAALKIACDYAREYEDCPFIEGEAALAKLGAASAEVKGVLK